MVQFLAVTVFPVAVLPVGVALVGEQQASARLGRQFATAGEVIGVNVRFGHVRDLQFLRGGFIQVLPGIADGIDDQAFPGFLAAHHVGRLC